MSPMMASAQIGGSLVSGAMGAKGAKDAAKAQKKLIRATAKEKVRRMDKDFAQFEGMAVGASAASGLQMTGSTKSFIEEMRQEHGFQKGWVKKEAHLAAKAASAGGQAAAQSSMAGGFSGAMQGANNLGVSQGWWK